MVSAALTSETDSGVTPNRAYTQAIISILAEKRTEVLAKDTAGYFIREWQELPDKVRQIITQDPRYQAIKADKAATGRI